MKKIILTFDYEVFLGKSGSIDNCIIKPTERIIKLLLERGLKAVFFVDVLFLKRLRGESLFEDLEKVEKNIQSIIKAGSFVELHIHPHWLDAHYDSDNEQWDLSNHERYRFESISEKKRNDLFAEGIGILEDICRKVDSKYKVKAFRAGGLCIQPFNIFEPLLNQHNILIESSVAVGMKNDSGAHKYDFRKAESRSPYRFSKDPLCVNKLGDFTQFPMLTYQVGFFQKLVQKAKGRSPLNVLFGDGESMSPQGSNITRSLFDRFKSTTYLFSLDGDFHQEVLFSKLIREKEEIITFINHPKLMSESSFKFIKRLDDCSDFLFSTFENEVLDKSSK